MLKEALSAELRRCQDAIAWAKAGLKKAPEGHLLVDAGQDTNRFYWRKSSKERKGAYLKHGQKDFIKALAQKDYEERLLKAALKEQTWLERTLAKQPENDPITDVYAALTPERKNLVEPFELDDEAYVAQWQAQEYIGNSHPFGGNQYFTRRGERVRSKSEILIADALDAAGVPYRYEQPLYLGGYNSVYPDFTVLNKRTRKEYYWEHMGGMDEPDYREGALKKLNDYTLAGVFPGDKLLVTFETASTPLDTRVVAAMIEQYLA